MDRRTNRDPVLGTELVQSVILTAHPIDQRILVDRCCRADHRYACGAGRARRRRGQRVRVLERVAAEHSDRDAGAEIGRLSIARRSRIVTSEPVTNAGGRFPDATAVTVTPGVGDPPVHDGVWLNPLAGICANADGSTVGEPVAGNDWRRFDLIAKRLFSIAIADTRATVALAVSTAIEDRGEIHVVGRRDHAGHVYLRAADVGRRQIAADEDR